MNPSEVAVPSSHPRQLNEIVELIMLTRPAALLDIGIGCGKYGFLAREYLEYWDASSKYGERRHRIDGIEAFESYVRPLQRQIYDEIFIGDAISVLPRLSRRYDLVLLIDVLEHCTREDGNRLLDQCMAVARNVIVSTPARMEAQGELFGNQYERHRQQWTRSDFGRFSPKFFVSNAYSILCYIGEQAPRVGPELRRRNRRAAVLRAAPWLRSLKRLLARPAGGRPR